MQRGERARQLLEEPLIKDSLAKLEQDVFEAWSRSAIRDKEGQHELLLMVQTVRKFRGLLEAVVMTGDIEKSNLKTPKLRQVLERFGVY